MGSEVSPLKQMVQQFPTDFWNDSCSVEELTYAISHGAVGATSNPTIVLEVLKKELHLWKDRILQLIHDQSDWTEEEIAWKIIEEIAVNGAKLLLPVFEASGHKKGRLSIQTNPINYRKASALIDQAIHFHSLAPNMQVKLPVTSVGIKAIEEVTYQGVSINATVSFCVPQAVAVAEAVERGLKRREVEGKSIQEMSPVCTIMVGRMDDWIQVLIKRDGVLADPGCAHWAGIACVKRASQEYEKKGYRTRLLAAAYRNRMHWAELMGGDLVLTIPYGWQKKFNASQIEVKDRFHDPVDPRVLTELLNHFPDFKRAYDPYGMSIDEFGTFGPTLRTLRTFISSYRELLGFIREFMLPDPDVK